MRRGLTWLLILLFLPLAPASAQGGSFAKLIERLSESGGFFQSDNLVSNEIAYLHPLATFRAQRLKGGVYLGVGPEQSFTYIAELEPELAVILDIRRDNLLLHLLFKSIFAKSRNRLEYLGMLFGRRMPADLPMWTDLRIESLVEYLDRTPFDSSGHEATHAKLMKEIEKYRVPLSTEDRTVMKRFHDEFARSGLDLRYTNRNRGFRMMLPTARDIYLATDQIGERTGYLATEDRWRVVRELERKNRIVPVVGNLAGPKAIRAIADYLTETKQWISVFYLSNVEQYLFRDGLFPTFVANVAQLPTRPNSLLIRSRFGRGIPGSYTNGLSSQHTQSFTRFLELTAAADSNNYWGVISDSVPLLVRP